MPSGHGRANRLTGVNAGVDPCKFTGRLTRRLVLPMSGPVTDTKNAHLTGALGLLSLLV